MVGRQHMTVLHYVAAEHPLIRKILCLSIHVAGPTSGNQHKQTAFHQQTENMQPLRTLSWLSTNWFEIARFYSCCQPARWSAAGLIGILLWNTGLEKYSRPTEISMEIKLDNFR